MLRWDRDAAALHAGMNDWIGQLNAIDAGQEYELRVANRLWAQQGYKFVPDFLKVTREMYRAELGQVNFQSQTEAARQTINRWVEQQTAGKIQNLIPVGRLSPQSRLVLTNAIYFKGDWETPFKKSRTRTTMILPAVRGEESQRPDDADDRRLSICTHGWRQGTAFALQGEPTLHGGLAS